MFKSLLPVPTDTRLPDVCRNLPEGLIAGFDPTLIPDDGDLVLAELPAGAGNATLDLVNGRSATVYPGDPMLVVTARYHAPLAVSCELPNRLDDAALVSRSGIAGRPTVSASGASTPAPLRLLGVAIDAAGSRVSLTRVARPMQSSTRPLNSVAVISVARGSHAARVAAAVTHGFVCMGLSTGVAKPLGMLDAGERWDFLDAGARVSLDPVDSAVLSSRGVNAPSDALLARACGMQGLLADSGCQVSVLRIAGGLGVREVDALLTHPGFAAQVDGVILAAADAMSAVTAAQRMTALGLPLIAVSGAISRSPLACREAGAVLSVPVLAAAQLTRPSTLHGLLSHGLRQGRLPSPALRLAA